MARVLILDDEKDMRSVLREVLETGGHEVYEAEDGDKGVAVYRQEQPDVVITDIIMPEKNGLEAIQELRREFPEVRIIAISTGGSLFESNSLYLNFAKEIGADRILPKPFSNQEILDAVESLLEGETVASE